MTVGGWLRGLGETKAYSAFKLSFSWDLGQVLTPGQRTNIGSNIFTFIVWSQLFFSESIIQKEMSLAASINCLYPAGNVGWQFNFFDFWYFGEFDMFQVGVKFYLVTLEEDNVQQR